MSVLSAPHVSGEMARQLAVEQKVCVRPIIRLVLDRDTGTDTRVAIPCGSTRESVCPSCADKARRLRIHQCAEGWHRTNEPETRPAIPADEDQHDDDKADEQPDQEERRVRSTRRRQDAPDLPKVPVEDRTVGRVFTAPDGREYRPSMFLTLTLPSYGKIRAGRGVPADPASYDYRRAALDALHFPKLVNRFWQNLRRCAGYKVQYFAAVEPQQRLAPHLHAALRGTIPRATVRQVAKATYVQLWWPSFDAPLFVHRTPVWDGTDYSDPDTGEVLPTWQEALDRTEADLDGKPVHVMRFGTQVDMAGIIAPSPDADRAVRYLTKYLTKSIAATYTGEQPDPAREAHVDRLHHELRWLPCTPGCANWLRYGIQPDHACPGLLAGRCTSPAHDRENLGIGGRRVLVSRQWSGKTLKQHRADRADVVREALLEAGIVAPEIERLAATVTSADGKPRFVWTDTKTDPQTYARVILDSVLERARWRTQYENAKATRTDGHTRSATGSQTGPDG